MDVVKIYSVAIKLKSGLMMRRWMRMLITRNCRHRDSECLDANFLFKSLNLNAKVTSSGGEFTRGWMLVVDTKRFAFHKFIDWLSSYVWIIDLNNTVAA